MNNVKDIMIDAYRNTFNFDPNDTYIDKFNKMIDEDKSDDSIMKALESLSFDLVITSDLPFRLTPDKMKDIVTFTDYFMKNYFSDGIKNLFHEDWDTCPMILDIGFSITYELLEVYLDILPQDERKNINLLIDYVMNRASEIQLISYNSEVDDCDCYRLPKIKDDSDKYLIERSIIELHKCDGVLIIREVSDMDKYITYSFVFSGGIIINVPAEKTKKILCTQIDGSVEINDNETFIDAPYIFQDRR